MTISPTTTTATQIAAYTPTTVEDTRGGTGAAGTSAGSLGAADTHTAVTTTAPKSNITVPTLQPPIPLQSSNAGNQINYAQLVDNISFSLQLVAIVLAEASNIAKQGDKLMRDVQRDLNIALQKEAAAEVRLQALLNLVATGLSAAVSITGAAKNISSQAKSLQVEKQAQVELKQADILKTEAKTLQTEAKDQSPGLAKDVFTSTASDKSKLAAETGQTGQTKHAEAAAMSANAAAWQQIAVAGGQILGSVGQMFAAHADARKAENTAEAERARAQAEDFSEFARALQDLFNKVTEILRAAEQASAQTNREIAKA